MVTDWPAEAEKRDRAIAGYVDDADPGRAAKYGFREGQNPRLAWRSFRDNPIGFNGVPFVLFKTLLDLDPNDRNPALRAIARIWRRQAAAPSGSGPSATEWTLDHIGIGPSPNDYVNGGDRPAGDRDRRYRSDCVRELAIVRALVRLGGGRVRRTTERAPGFQNSGLLSVKLRTRSSKTTGRSTARASGARAPWIACSSHVPLVTSAVSWWRGR